MTNSVPSMISEFHPTGFRWAKSCDNCNFYNAVSGRSLDENGCDKASGNPLGKFNLEKGLDEGSPYYLKTEICDEAALYLHAKGIGDTRMIFAHEELFNEVFKDLKPDEMMILAGQYSRWQRATRVRYNTICDEWEGRE